MATANVGQTITNTIEFLDATGAVMTTVPTPDSPPTWTGSDPTVETLSISADGLTATATAMAAGAFTLSLSVVVAGVTYTATISDTIGAVAGGQVLTSVRIKQVVA